MSESKKLKQAKHKEKTPEEIQNIIRSRKIAKEKGISKKDMFKMKLKKMEKKRMKQEEKISSSKITYEDSVRIMTFGKNIDSYTKKILDDYHNDISSSVISRETKHVESCKRKYMIWQLQQEQQRRSRLEIIAQQFDEYEETSPYYNSYHGIDEENFRDVESNHVYCDFSFADWLFHEDNQSK